MRRFLGKDAGLFGKSAASFPASVQGNSQLALHRSRLRGKEESPILRPQDLLVVAHEVDVQADYLAGLLRGSAPGCRLQMFEQGKDFLRGEDGFEAGGLVGERGRIPQAYGQGLLLGAEAYAGKQAGEPLAGYPHVCCADVASQGEVAGMLRHE